MRFYKNRETGELVYYRGIRKGRRLRFISFKFRPCFGLSMEKFWSAGKKELYYIITLLNMKIKIDNIGSIIRDSSWPKAWI